MKTGFAIAVSSFAAMAGDGLPGDERVHMRVFEAFLEYEAHEAGFHTANDVIWS